MPNVSLQNFGLVRISLQVLLNVIQTLLPRPLSLPPHIMSASPFTAAEGQSNLPFNVELPAPVARDAVNFLARLVLLAFTFPKSPSPAPSPHKVVKL